MEDDRERLVVITPGAELPAGRWTMNWSALSRTIELGRKDMSEAIKKSGMTRESVVYGQRAAEIKAVL